MCSCHGAVLVPVGAATRRYSSGGRAATRPLLVQRRAATRPLLARRPCWYSSATRPAAVLLLARYQSGNSYVFGVVQLRQAK